MTSLELNRTMCDWITKTSYKKDHWQIWRKMLAEIARGAGCEVTESSLYQYAGWRIKPPTGGSAFLGSGDQSGETHFLMSIGGRLADQVYLSDGFEGARCTRIDLQCTIEQPEDHNQRRVQQEARERGIEPIYWPSGDGSLVTVYFGNLKGTDNVVTRLYQKVADDGKILLRLECMFRGKKAAAVWSLLKAGRRPSGIVRSAMPNLDIINQLFGAQLDDAVPVVVRRTEHNTAVWLKRTVLPSFTRYINGHDADPEIAEMFWLAIDREQRWKLP